jgi:hypothetical protein
MAHFRLRNCVAFAVILGSVPLHAFYGRELFERQSSCVSGYVHCNDAPAGFCCESTARCLLLAKNTTVRCCPNGGTCQVIDPITCDISQQNISLFPSAQLKTTNLTASLPTCGSLCCPFGYSCSGGTVCTMNANEVQNSLPPSSTSTIASSPTFSPTRSSTSKPLAAGSAPPPISQSPSPATQPACNAFPAGAVLAGFFPGLIGGAFLAVAIFCLFGAYRRRQHRLSGGFGISEPIYHESSAMRADFIRKQGSAPSTPTRQPTIERVRSLFRRSTAATGADMSETPRTPVPAMPRQTPPSQRASGECINVFADPLTARTMPSRDSHLTTFTDMLREANLSRVARGEPFVHRTSSSTTQSAPLRWVLGH